MPIDAKTVAELRHLTGAGMMDAKKALEETGGDLENAAEELRKKGVAKAAKRAERETKEGRVHAYLHSNNKLGALVEVQCETDFVARNEDFQVLCNDLAMHVSAADPLYLRREDVPQEVIDKEIELFKAELKEQGKPEGVVDKIVEGKMNKYFSEIVLLEQEYIKDDSKTIDELIKEAVAKIGENIQITRFSRFHIA
ncbi:translation elongation factor Ts [Patescibacteria group bacterium]